MRAYKSQAPTGCAIVRKTYVCIIGIAFSEHLIGVCNSSRAPPSCDCHILQNVGITLKGYVLGGRNRPFSTMM